MSSIDANLISTLEQSLRQTIAAQKGLVARLREVEEERERLRQQIDALEGTAEQTARAIDSVLSTVRPDSSSQSRLSSLEAEREDYRRDLPKPVQKRTVSTASPKPNSHTVAYMNDRGSLGAAEVVPSSNRFSDRTITQACTLILREHGKPLHVNDLYQILLDGGMEFTGNNPTISIAVSLNRNRRFCKVAPGTFDLVIKDASQAAS